MKINRRGALALFGAGTGMVLPKVAIAAQPGPVRYAHGVASGDPAADGAVIWTRISVEEGVSGDIPVSWFIAKSESGDAIRKGSALARESADRTVKVEVDGLQAGQEYWYGFEGPNGEKSPVGRFRTLPAGTTDSVVLAVASCQLYPGGLFNAYADMARRPRLDAVVHLGDYIYEYGDTGYGADTGRQLGRNADPAHEIVTLEDYRRRHAQVKSDADLQAAHARAAFICVWDDHEVANDSWLGGAENHQPETEGAWAARKAVAMQAYFEWMPIRDPSRVRAKEAIFRSFEFGDLATLAMVETRLLARTEQLAPKGEVGEAGKHEALLAERARPERELLGEEQRAWLEGVLTASVAAGKPWQVLGNQVVMARVNGPDIEEGLGKQKFDAMMAKLPEEWRFRLGEALAGYRVGVPFNLDSWDGYPAARERLYQSFKSAGAKPIVLAGDSHAAWANNLSDDSGTLVAVEAGCTAISSPSYGALLPGIGRYIAAASEEVAYCNQDSKGYTLLTLTPQDAKAEYITVSTITDKAFESSVDAAFRVQSGNRFGPWSRV